jgi:hypothetical protein
MTDDQGDLILREPAETDAGGSARPHLPRLASLLLGNRELAELLGVTSMDIKNWDRRGKLPEPIRRLECGPVWEEAQFSEALKKTLRTPSASGRRRKSAIRA